MTRRIVLTVLTLIGALLVTTVVPLGIVTTGREREAFQEDTALSARALAAMAEESLADHKSSLALTWSLARARRHGEEVRIYDARGRLAAGTGGAVPLVPAAALAHVLDGGGALARYAGDRLQVAVSLRVVLGSGTAGAVVLSRSTGELDERLRVLWMWLAAVAVAGLLTGAIVAVAFARWVGRPLTALDVAAQRLGGGALDTRSPAAHGPPEVRRLAGNFNTMAGRLEALVHGHRATMADVSHQLRTPLAALRLRLDLLSADADEATAAELADAQEEIARLSRMVDGLLAIARAENVVAEPVPVPVCAVIRDRAAAWGPVAEERGVFLATDCPGPARASLGEGHLEQILDNLLANALEAVPPGGRVRVAARATARGTQIIVADDGPGMSPQQRDTAFRRFASASPGGAGLGLAIVHRLVTSNGGSAALSDTADGGLTITIDLPEPVMERVRRPGGGSSARANIPY